MVTVKDVKEFWSDDLSITETAKLLGMGFDYLSSRVLGGLDLSNKNQMFRFIMLQKPIIENWSTKSKLAKKWRVPKYIMRGLYYSESSRKECGAVKIREVYRFDPEWEKEIDEYIKG